jgi:hypothetical protein
MARGASVVVEGVPSVAVRVDGTAQMRSTCRCVLQLTTEVHLPCTVLDEIGGGAVPLGQGNMRLVCQQEMWTLLWPTKRPETMSLTLRVPIQRKHSTLRVPATTRFVESSQQTVDTLSPAGTHAAQTDAN